MIETPFAFLDEQVEVLLGDTVVASHVAFCLVPEVLDPVDVVGIFGEQFRVVDAHMVELLNVQNVIGSEAVGIDDGIRPHLVANDREKRVSTGIWNDHDMDFTAPLQKPEDGHLTSGTSSPLAFSTTAKIALIDLDFAAHQAGFRSSHLFEDHFPEFVEKQHSRVAVYASQLGRRTGCHPSAEILQKLDLNTSRKPAPTPRPNHLTSIAFLSYLCQPLIFKEGLKLCDVLLARDRDNSEWQRGLSLFFSRIGDARLMAGEMQLAFSAYHESLSVDRMLLKQQPDNLGLRHEFSLYLEKIADLKQSAGDVKGALSLYEESLVIVRELAESNDSTFRRSLSVSLDKIGDLRLTSGNEAGALNAFNEGLKMSRGLVALDPSNTEWQRDLVISLVKVANAGNNPRESFAEALVILKRLDAAGELGAEQSNWIALVESELGRLGRPEPVQATAN